MDTTNPDEIQLETPRLHLAAQLWGPADGRPVLALHGWLDNAATYIPLAQHLTGVRLAALDLPGHGHSGHRSPGMHYHFVDYISDVVAAADALGWERFTLLGHSLGAAVASITAAVIPERIDKLAVIEGLGPLTSPPEKGAQALHHSIQQMNRLEEKRLPVYSDVAKATLARHTAGGLTFESAKLLSERGSKPVGGGVTWRSDPRLRIRSPSYLTEEQVHAYLRNIEAPTQLVLAKDGHLINRESMTKRYECVRQLEVVELDGNHHLHLDDPQPTAASLNRFFTD